MPRITKNAIKLLNNEIQSGTKKNLVKPKSLIEIREDFIRHYHNKILTTAEEKSGTSSSIGTLYTQTRPSPPTKKTPPNRGRFSISDIAEWFSSVLVGEGRTRCAIDAQYGA